MKYLILLLLAMPVWGDGFSSIVEGDKITTDTGTYAWAHGGGYMNLRNHLNILNYEFDFNANDCYAVFFDVPLDTSLEVTASNQHGSDSMVISVVTSIIGYNSSQNSIPDAMNGRKPDWIICKPTPDTQ